MKRFIFFTLFTWALAVGTFGFNPSALANEQLENISVGQRKGAELEFEKMLETNLPRVEEFRFIKQWAEKKGIQAYLFGGAATAFGVYSRWEKEHQAGQQKFSAERFDFKVSNIFHFNQDVDILIEADVEMALELQKELDTHFPYQKTTGGKTISVWEVRCFRHAIGYKPAVIGNPDFQNQNTDSNSTGLIELTDPKEGRSRIQDLRGFREGEGRFFQDLMEGRISYYNTSLHENTSRSTAANPVTISALRFIIKLFEYDLKTDDQSIKNALKVLQRTDYQQVHSVRGSRRWVEKNGAKLLDNAVNIEQAWFLLQRTGLLERLAIFGPESDPTSMAWLLKHKPLVSYPLAAPAADHKTSASLNIKTAYLKLDSFKEFERLRMGHLSAPNLLSDKARVKLTLNPQPKPGEVWVGFHIHPYSVLDKDFQMLDANGIRVRNRASLSIIPETLRLPRERLVELIHAKADPDFVAYIVRQNNLLNTLTEAEYTPIKKFLEDGQEGPYSAVLLPLVIKYEARDERSTPAKFIQYIEKLLKDGTMKKSEVAQIAISSIDDFFALKPSYAEAKHMKGLIRHGPQYVAYMTMLMNMYVKTAADYIELLGFDNETPTENDKKRVSYFVESSFKKFLDLKPNEKETEFVLNKLLPEAKEKVIKENSCDQFLKE